MHDPTGLALFTYRHRSPAAALREFAALANLDSPRAAGMRTATLDWRRYRSRARSDPTVAVELAAAKRGPDAHVAALVAR
jgi:hypothetical protein